MYRMNLTLLSGIGVQLVDGSVYNEGRVEILHAGEWGSICKIDFTMEDATVICRMLGLNTRYV